MADRRELWLTCCIGPADRLYVADHAHGVCLETSTKGEFGRSVFLAPEDEAKLLAFLLDRSLAVLKFRADLLEAMAKEDKDGCPHCPRPRMLEEDPDAPYAGTTALTY